MNSFRQCLLFCLAVASTTYAEITFSTTAEEGFSINPRNPGAFVYVERTSDGYILETFTTMQGDYQEVTFSWEGDEDSWWRVSVDRGEVDGQPVEHFDLVMHEHYDPFGTTADSSLNRIGLSRVFPPHGDHLRIHQSEFYVPSDSGNLITYEFSVQEVLSPMQADFNFDGVVDFADFLVLSKWFGTDTKDFLASFPMRDLGDANMDFLTDFDDFAILSQHFGATPAFAVPEPSSVDLAALGFLGLGLLRRRP